LSDVGRWVAEAIYINYYGSLQTTNTDDYPANTSTTGVVTPGGGQVSGNIETTGDRDWFRVQVTQGSTYTISLVSGNVPQVAPFLGDPEVYLYNSSGQFVNSNDDFGGLNSQLTFTAAYTGNYFIGAGEHGDNATGTYRVSVSAGTEGNHVPVANNDSYTTSFNTALTRTAATGVLANDTDQDGNTLTAILLTNPSHGSLTLNTNGSFTYTPTTGYSGTDSFTYFDSDGSTTSNNATVSLTVGGPTNHAPVANADSYSTSFNTALTRTAATGVLANDTDQDGNPLTAILLTNPSHGSLTFNTNGSFTYTPTTGYSGTDSFTYFDSDGSTTSNNTTVSLTIGGQTNHAPVANADSYSTSFNTPLTISGPGVLANDTDQDGNNVSVASIGTVPAHGTLQAFTDGSFTYTPTSTYSGPDSFTYFVTDGTLTSVSAATVSITVGPGGSGTTNHAPVANSDSYSTSFNTALTISGPGVLANDTDQDGNNVSVASIGVVPTHGTLQAFTDGSFTYTPTSTYSGPDSFTYFVTDGTLTSVSAATVSITVGGPTNHAPVANNDSYTTSFNTALTIAAAGVLANDADQDGNSLTVGSVSSPSHGTLQAFTNGSFTYTPNSGYSGADSFTYFASDGTLNSATAATVSITVDHAPLFSAFTSPLAAFAIGAGGWTDQTQYPREVADVNGDGMADIVGFGANGAIVSLATGNGHFAALTSGIGNFGFLAAGGGWVSQDQYPRQLADVNGDGMADIVGFGADGVIVSLATGNGHFASPVAGISNFGFLAAGGGWVSQDQYPRQLADVNGDGMADIVGFGADGVIVSLATGNGHFASPVAGISNFGFLAAGGGWTSENQYPRLLADVNGDGMADIVGFGADGAIVSLATGNGHFASPVAGIQNFGFLANGGGWASENQYPRQLADVNGDHMADIIGFGANGAIVSLATGNGHFASPVAGISNFGFLAAAGGWTSQDLYPRALGDVNGDGAADIIGFGHDGVFEALSNGFHLI
jgi:VCBS repeat-containing protein